MLFAVILSASEGSPGWLQNGTAFFVARLLRMTRETTMNQYYVYILTNTNNRVMYIGVTNNLQRRLYEHKNQLVAGFTKKYNIHKLVYFEITTDILSAIEREKQLKGWKRDRKNELVESMNPKWEDLSEKWI